MTTRPALVPQRGYSEKPVPYDIYAEKSVVAACLSRPENLIEVAPLVAVTDFYVEAYASIYAAELRLHERNERVNVVSVSNELKKRGKLELVNNGNALSEIYSVGLKVNDALSYARIVADKAIRRVLIQNGGRIAGLGFEEDRETDDLLEEMDQLIAAVRPTTARPLTLANAVAGVLDKLDQGGTGFGVPTGFDTLDLLTSGHQAGDLVVVAARPSNGKSTLALEFALAAAFNGCPCQFFSVEMSAEQLAMRTIANLAGVNLNKIRTGTLSDHELGRVLDKTGAAEEAIARIHLDDSGAQSIGRIRAAMRQSQHRHKTRLVVIDYLQLIEGIRKSRSDNQNNEIASVTRGLKMEAVHLGVTVILLSQMSREVERRSNHRPMLSDLRDSGAIEQDADMVMFIHRPALYDPTADKTLAELQIAKQRNGPVGDVPLRWNADITKFAEA
jgi:replicative DNA helicase